MGDLEHAYALAWLATASADARRRGTTCGAGPITGTTCRDWLGGPNLGHCDRLAQTAEPYLHQLVGREDTDWAIGQARPELCARLTEDLADERARREDCRR